MSEEQDRNRYEWAQLFQADYFQALQQAPVQQGDVPEWYVPAQDYAPFQGYAPVEAQNGYSDYRNSTASSFETHHNQEVNVHSVNDDDIPEEEIRDFVSKRRQKRKSKKEQPLSKRAQRRREIAEKHQGEVSASNSPKGLVELREGVLHWWDPVDEEFLKAAYHDQYRDQFILEDSAEGTYVSPPARGEGLNDVTTPCSAYNQLQWRLTDRDSWDNIVDADGNKVLYLLNRPLNQSYDEPERLWYHDGCVLLDGDNNPVRPWAGIPRCFSSKLSGGHIEALRRILPMTIQDFRARMLRKVPIGAGIEAGTKPLSFPSTFGHRSSRFRIQYQCPAWTPRAASDVLKKQVTDLLPEAEEATTTKGLQVLSRYEIERRKSLTRGRYLYKANGRAISEDERKNRDRKFEKKLETQAARQPKMPQRPLQSVPATSLQSASPQSLDLPTPPLSAGIKRRREDDDGSGDSGASLAKQGRFGTSASSQRPIPKLSRGLPEFHPQTPEAKNTGGSASPDGIQNYNDFQFDFRFVDPQSPFDQLSIQAALFYPRAHYYALTGQHPPQTSEGTYAHQYLQLSTLLAQNWLLDGGLPSLADVGPWGNSFSMVPTPNLPAEVMDIVLRANAPSASAEASTTTDHHQAQGFSAVLSGAGNVQGIPSAMAGTGLESDGWSDDFFAEYVLTEMENVAGDEEWGF